MRQGQAGAAEAANAGASEAVRGRIVVAGDPGPAGLAHQAGEAQAIGIEQGRGAFVAVEAVAKRDDFGGAGVGEVGFETAQGEAGVVGRQQAAAFGEGRELLEVQIGDQQGVLGGPVEGAGGERLETVAGEVQLHGVACLGWLGSARCPG